MNNRAIEGAAAVARSAAAQRQGSPNALRIFPVPTRVEVAEYELRQHAFELAKKVFSDMTPHLRNESEYWSDVSVPYIPSFSFNEIPAAFAGGYESTVLDPLARLTSYLTGGQVCRLVPVPEDQRISVLGRYRELTS